MHFELPITEPVLIFALALSIFLIVPLFFERLRIPGLIGLIIAGAVVGPNGLGLLARDATIILLGTVGLLYLMFLVGLELDLHEFNRHRNHSIIFGLLSFALPQAVGTGLSLLLGYGLAPSVLLGAMFASHTLLAYPIASRLGIVKTGAVTTVLGATLITDMLALLVLAIVSGSREGGIGLGFWAELLGLLTVYVAAVMWGVPKIGRWFFRRVQSDGTAEFIFTLAMLFVFAFLAELAGIEPIIGALLTGFALNRLIPEHSALMNRVKFVANTVFVPFFLLSVGMLVDVRAFADRSAWITIVVLVFATVVSKAVVAKVTQRWFGFQPEDGWVMFGLSVSHAAATMAIVLVGYEIGLFDETIVNAVVVIILVTCMVGPWATERFGRRVALREEQRPYEPSEAPQRILLPLSNPKTAEALLDLAFIVRGSDSAEPLHPLMVARDDQDPEAAVAEAEKMLGHAVLYGTGADVPVVPLTRVDRNIAAGITRGAAETRASTIVIGWDGRRSGGRWIFGSVLDQLLKQTRQLVLVAKLGHPLNTTRRIVLVLPPAIDRQPGFLEAVRTTKLLASGLGASLTGLVVRDDPTSAAERFDATKPQVPVSFERIPEWSGLLRALRDRLRPDDLVVVISAREGTPPWHPRLERLPGQLAGLVPESFVTLYPPEVETGERAATASPFAELLGGRVIELRATRFEGALEEMVGTSFNDPDNVRAVVNVLVRSEREFSNEVAPGVMVPHARVRDLRQPIVVLGISREGIRFPNAGEPARLIFLLISDTERPDEHLRHLAEIARFVSDPDRVAELLEEHAPGTPTDWLHTDVPQPDARTGGITR